MSKRSLSDLERFQSHVQLDPLTGCHNWTGATTDKGYPHFSVRRSQAEKRNPRWGNKRVLAHRWIFEQVNGPVPAGEEVDHKCCNPRCVNVDEHLQRLPKELNLALRGRVHLDQAEAGCFSGEFPIDQARLTIN